MRFTLSAGFLAATALLLGGCTNSGSGRVTVAESVAQLEGDWNLRAIGDAAVTDLADEADLRRWPSMQFGPDGQVGGWTGVNNWSAMIDLGELPYGRFTVGPIRSTLMAGPEAAMRLEAAYMSALQQSTGYTLEGGVLLLRDEDGNLVLSFTSAAD